MATGLGLLERLLLWLKGARCAGEDETWEAERSKKTFKGLMFKSITFNGFFLEHEFCTATCQYKLAIYLPSKDQELSKLCNKIWSWFVLILILSVPPSAWFCFVI